MAEFGLKCRHCQSVLNWNNERHYRNLVVFDLYFFKLTKEFDASLNLFNSLVLCCQPVPVASFARLLKVNPL